MKALTISNLRCFKDETRALLSPLTFLVGENSTGKSTFLAASRIAWDIAYSRAEPDFNEDPFVLGAYDDLAHFHGGQAKRARSFDIGLTIAGRAEPPSGKRGPDVEVVGTFTKRDEQPFLSSLVARTVDGGHEIIGSLEEECVKLQLRTPKGVYSAMSRRVDISGGLSIGQLFFFLDVARSTSRRHDGSRESMWRPEPPEEETRSVGSALSALRQRIAFPGRRPHTRGRPYAIAPIRTKPKRTYDPLTDAPRPEGDHVPMLLARLSAAEPEAWEEISEQVRRFGIQSGLFESIKVKRLGKGAGMPFQLHVRMKSQKKDSNLVDVGYGVSQVLPIIVDCLMEPKQGIFLMQQPEVHLHPRAQAALGSFFCELVGRRGHKFIIETHSDYLIDRVRQVARQGNDIDHRAVSVLYFDREGPQVNVHPMSLDQTGEFVDQPPKYRQFFVDEQLRLLGVSRDK